MAEDSRPHLVFFGATHSGPARRMESLMAHLARKERARLRVTTIDVNEQPELAERFRVDTVPTLALVELLLQRGADARARTPTGHSGLDLAERWHGKIEVVPALERRGAPRAERTALDELVVAAAYGDESRARSLLGDDPELLAEARDRDRSRVAAFAEAGNRQGAVILAKLGFDLQAPSWMGMTALHWAACRGNPLMLRELLEAGAPMLDVPGFGTPLHTALHQRWTSFGHLPGEGDYLGVVRVLLAAGAHVPSELRPSGDIRIDALIDAAR